LERDVRISLYVHRYVRFLSLRAEGTEAWQSRVGDDVGDWHYRQVRSTPTRFFATLRMTSYKRDSHVGLRPPQNDISCGLITHRFFTPLRFVQNDKHISSFHFRFLTFVRNDTSGRDSHGRAVPSLGVTAFCHCEPREPRRGNIGLGMIISAVVFRDSHGRAMPSLGVTGVGRCTLSPPSRSDSLLSLRAEGNEAWQSRVGERLSPTDNKIVSFLRYPIRKSGPNR